MRICHWTKKEGIFLLTLTGKISSAQKSHRNNFFIYPETENKKRIVFYVSVFLFMFSDHKKLQIIHDWSNKSNEKKTKSNWTIFVSLFLLRRRTLFLYKLLLYIYIIILVMLIYIFNKKKLFQFNSTWSDEKKSRKIQFFRNIIIKLKSPLDIFN